MPPPAGGGAAKDGGCSKLCRETAWMQFHGSARDRSGIPRDFPQGKPVELERIARFPARRAGNAPKRRG
jgi:hypothetical protein